MRSASKHKLISRNFAICALIVLVSVLLHSLSLPLLYADAGARDEYRTDSGLPYLSEMDSYLYCRLTEDLATGDISEYTLRHSRGEEERMAPTQSADQFVMQPTDGVKRLMDSEDVVVIDHNLKGLDFQMARCCQPVYGDDVFGFVTSGGGIKIHRENCPNAPQLRERFGYRIVKARWAGKRGSQYPITLRVVGNDDLGIVNNITSIISKEENILLRSISIDSHDGLFSGTLTVMLEDAGRLQKLIKKLKTVKGVKNVSRS